MSDLDQRVVVGLHELAARAPVDAEVWGATGRRVVTRRRRRRTAMAAITAVALVVGAGATITVVRGTKQKVVVSEPGGLSDTTTTGSSSSALAATGPSEGSFTITAAPSGRLAFSPPALTVATGIYAVTLVDGSATTHTLEFADPSALWSQLLVDNQGESQTSRVFFGLPGTYTFYCVIPGHRAAGMQGVVTVTGPPITLAQAEANGTTSGGSADGVETTPTTTAA